MPTYRILRGYHKEGGVLYVPAKGTVRGQIDWTVKAARPGGLSGRKNGGDLIVTDKDLLALNCDSPGDQQPKFELVAP